MPDGVAENVLETAATQTADQVFEGLTVDQTTESIFEELPEKLPRETLAEAPKTESKAPVWTKGFINMFFVSITLNLGMFMSNSILSVYADSLGATAGAVGLIMATFAISALLFRMISAPIMDTYNRKYIVTFATAVIAVSFFGFSMSNTVPALLGFRLLQGCGMAFGNACCLAIVAGMIPKERYSSGIGYFSLAQVVCQALGPFTGLLMVDFVGFKMTFAINTGILLVAVFLATRLKLTHQKKPRTKLTFNNVIAKEAVIPSSVIFILSTGIGVINSFLILFANNLGVANIGLFFVVSAATMLFTRPLVGKLTDRFGIIRIAVPALLCNIIAFFVIGFTTTLWGFLLAAFISAFGSGACQPALQALAMKATPAERRGAASSTTFVGLDLGSLLGPLIAGGVVQAIGYVPMWPLMSIAYVIGTVILLLFRKKITRIEKDFEAD